MSQNAPPGAHDNADKGTGTSVGEWRRLPDGAMTLSDISPFRQALDGTVTGFIACVMGWFPRHWLLFVNGALALLLTGAALTPLFYAFGWPLVGHALFAAYHTICAQIPSHSYFLLGYQVALCARNLAIYGSLFLGSLLFRWMRAWLPPLDWRLWALTMVPMAWDGGTGLFGLRESTWELRTLTGAIFGLGVCWFLLPLILANETSSMKTSAHSGEATA